MSDNVVNATEEERRGVEMIQALKAYAGVRETEEVSLDSWRRMDAHTRAQTQWAYDFFIIER